MNSKLPRKFLKKLQSKPETIALKPKKLQFPSISLVIPEGLLKYTTLGPVFITAFTLGFLGMAIGIVGNDLRVNFIRLSEIYRDRSAVEAQIAQWKNVLGKFNNYKDGYLMVSTLEYSLGDYQQSYEYAAKALEIDPNYKEAKLLLERISDR